jgi:DNA-binding MarR family transcriptional regulator
MSVQRSHPHTRRSRRAAAARAPVTPSTSDVLAEHVPQGRHCGFANTRLLARVVTSFYDEALRPCNLRASQLALLWAIAACEPVDITRLSEVTATDQTTLSRTIDKLRRSGLVDAEAGDDRRVRLMRLSTAGRDRFAEAMPYWNAAQREIERWLSLSTLENLARQARRLARSRPAAGDVER